MRNTKIITSALLIVCLAGCAAPRYPNYFSADQISRPYTLGSGDRLRIIVFGQDNLTNIYSVDGSGNIAMPLIGTVHAQGLTTSRLSDEIAAKFRGGILRDPKVSVEVETYRPFFILGEVSNAGQYPFVNGMTVETAVAIAGGFTPRAAHSNATLTRIVDGKIVKATVPMTQPVMPGDSIAINERYF